MVTTVLINQTEVEKSVFDFIEHDCQKIYNLFLL